MLRALGGTVQQSSLCCMVCNPTEVLESDVMRVGKPAPRKKRRVAIRKVDESVISDIKSRLQEERVKYIAEHSGLAILGVQLVCPNSVINNICSSVRFISVANDMDSFCLRQELKERFFNVIMAVVNSSSVHV